LLSKASVEILSNTIVSMIPCITIDGPTASGKGTVALRLAQTLGFHYLDSGAIYRALALWSELSEVAPHEDEALQQLALTLPLSFSMGGIYLGDEEVGEHLRAEDIGLLASELSAKPLVRSALLQRQRDFLQAPGLCTDGRDMGTVVFPQATLKIFLLASPLVRAERRYKQLMEKGKSVIMADLLADLEARDARDRERSVAPTVPASDAHIIDCTSLGADAVVGRILAHWQAR
jgi:cytidylate kinase